MLPPGNWAVHQSLQQRKPFPNSQLSSASTLQELAARLALEDAQPSGESLHQYTSRLLEARLPASASTSAIEAAKAQQMQEAEPGSGPVADAV
eukprot:scaffold592278_cov45-Prasinocladus_malaysianus.AAC.1